MKQAICLGLPLGFLAVWFVVSGETNAVSNEDGNYVAVAAPVVADESGIPAPTLVSKPESDSDNRKADSLVYVENVKAQIEEQFASEILSKLRAKTNARKMVKTYSHALRLAGGELKGVTEPSEAFRRLVAGVQGPGELVFSIPAVSEEEIEQAAVFVQFADGKMITTELAELDPVEQEIERLVSLCEKGACEKCVERSVQVTAPNRLQAMNK